MNFRCLFGHKLQIIRAVSRQTALCACENCGAEYAVKMEGEHAGAKIKWAAAKSFYESSSRILNLTA